MKKIISLLMALCIVLGLCACGGSAGGDQQTEPQAYAGLQAGYARVDVSPATAVGMGGYGDNDTRLSTHIMDETYATCVALRQGDTTFLIFTVDVCAAGDIIANQLRNGISAETGVPEENIIVGATHTHSAATWNGSTSAGCMTAAKEAIADLAPATMEIATTQLENMNFVRHYEMNDGTFYGSNFGSDFSGFKKHVLDSDKQLSLVNMNREGKKDILMINWAAHPAAAARQHGDAGYTGISADFVGYMRKKVEMEAGVLVAYYTAASGNVNPKSLITSENTNNNTNYQSYGSTLGAMIIETMALLKPVENTEMKAAYSKFQVEIDHSWDHMAGQASEVVGIWKTKGLEAGHKLAREYGMSSAYHANAIVGRGSYKGDQFKHLYALSIGPVALINNDYEMFSDHGLYVKENSPFEMTFIVTGCSGYIANEAAYDYRSYESDTSPYVKGTGEKLAEEMARLLNTMK